MPGPLTRIMVMAWTNYRNLVDRFGHIDAEFVKSTGLFSSDDAIAELVVRFYPWWEHPQYLSAVERGERWGFSSYEAGKREVTVRAIRGPDGCRTPARAGIDRVRSTRCADIQCIDTRPYDARRCLPDR
jgi:hypothetical protein